MKKKYKLHPWQQEILTALERCEERGVKNIVVVLSASRNYGKQYVKQQLERRLKILKGEIKL